MKTNHTGKAIITALLLGTGLSGASAASLLADGDFDSLPAGTAPDVGTPAGHWFWPAGEMAFERAVSQVSIVPAPAGGTVNCLQLSITATEFPANAMHLPNFLGRSVTKASGEILHVSFDIYVEPGRGGGSIGLGKGYAGASDRGPQFCWLPNGVLHSTGTGGAETLISSYPRGVWQTVRLEVDLARDRFNFYWSEKGQPVSVIRSNLTFRSGSIPYIDRFVIGRFPDDAEHRDAHSHIDNIRVSAGEPATVVPGQSFALPGGSVTLSVTNTLNVPSIYQWQFNGTNLPGAAGPTLALSNVTTNQSGPYSAIVSNAFEVVAASPAAVQVVTSVTISSQPKSTNVLPGTSVTLNVAAISPISPITYQWQFNGTNLAGQTNAILSLTNAQFDPHTGYYRVLVSDTVSNVWSDTAALIVMVRPTVTSQPVAQTVLQGGTAIFSVSVAPDHPLLPLNYRWTRQGVNFLSNAPPTLVITNVQPGTAGSFRVTITNLAGSVSSASVNLTVLPDFDYDGMADAWEKLHGFDTNSVADALLDFDGDRMINRNEYDAGTSPTNAASVLKLQLASPAGGQSALTFLAISNRTYSVEWNTEASGGTWNRLQDVLAQPADRIENVTDTNTGGSMRFYRVGTPRQL